MKTGTASSQSRVESTMTTVAVEMACARKMIAFSGAPEYDPAVKARMNKEMGKAVAAQNPADAAREEQKKELRKG